MDYPKSMQSVLHTDLGIIYSSFVQNGIDNLIGIPLNLYIDLDSMVSLSILILSVLVGRTCVWARVS